MGAGDGSRTQRVAQAARIGRVVVLEPSAAMRASAKAPVEQWAEVWPITVEDLPGKSDEFDAIVCLWNVLGHIFPAGARGAVLCDLRRLLAPDGRLFLDVNHRYNAREYGVLPTAIRFLRDWIAPHPSNGDVTARWTVNGETCTTRGHVFTDDECLRLFAAAGLELEKRFVVDYRIGAIRRSLFSGNLLYVLQPRPSTPADSD